MELKLFKDKLFEKAKIAGFEEYELYCQSNTNNSVSVFQGEVEQFINASSNGLSFKGKYGGKMGVASSEEVDETVIDFLVESAKANAEVIETLEEEELYPGDREYPKVERYNPDLNDVTTEQKIKVALAIEKAAFGTDPRIVMVPGCMFSDGEMEVLIANSKGLDVTQRSNYYGGGAQCQASDGQSIKMGFYMAVGSYNYDKLSPGTVGKKAAVKTLETLGAAPVPSGKYKVVLENDCASSLLNVFFGAFSADAAHKGFSLLKGKLGEKVAADCVTIIDDPLIPWAMGSQPFDSEGVACYSKTVVENGVFKTFLHNLKTARKDGVKPTGNGFKGGYNAPLSIGPTNFFIQPSEQNPEELFAKAGDGLIITDFQGLHAGANPVSGEFSLQAQGFVIKGGKKDKPVELITVSGNFFRLLENIVAVADDLDFENPRSINTIVSPSILVDSLDIAGS